MTDAPDADLAVRARDGDREAWATLCQRHAPRLAAYLGARLRRPKVVEKLVEDAIVLASKHLEELEQPADFPGWFRRVGAHLALRWYREHSDEKLAEGFPPERVGEDPDLQRRMDKLENALAALTDAHRMAIEQRFRGGLSGESLAEALHLEPAKADRLVDDALAALDRAWEKEGA